MMFSMSRDRHLPLGSLWGQVNPMFKTPANAAIAVGVLAAIPILVIGPLGGFSMSIAATGLIYLSYFLCNIGVLAARFRGWPHKPAWFNLGAGACSINILALVYGGLMLINIGHLAGPGALRRLRRRRPGDHEPDRSRLHQAVRQRRSRACRPGRSSRSRRRLLVVGAHLLRRVGSRPGRGRRGPMPPPARPSSAEPTAARHARCGARASARRLACRRAMTTRSRTSCAASCATSSSRALRRVPELAGGELTLTACPAGSRTATTSSTAPARAERYVIRLAGNDTHLLGISREVEHAATVAAAGVGVGPEVMAFIRPEGYLVTRFIEGRRSREAGIAAGRRSRGSARRCGGSTTGRRSRAVRAVPDRRGVSRAGARARRRDPARVRARRRRSPAGSSSPVSRRRSSSRPCHNDLLNANFIDDGARIRIVDWEYAGMGDPFFDLGNFSINHELTSTRTPTSSRRTTARPPAAPAARADADARPVGFPRGDVGRAPAGRRTLDVDFVAYAASTSIGCSRPPRPRSSARCARPRATDRSAGAAVSVWVRCRRARPRDGRRRTR